MERNSPQAIYDLLKEWGIEFKSMAHPEAATMEDCKAIGEKLGAPFCKNLFLANRQQTEFFLLLIGEDKKFRTAEVSKKIGRSRLSFGNEDKLYQALGVRPGSISPLGLVFQIGIAEGFIVNHFSLPPHQHLPTGAQAALPTMENGIDLFFLLRCEICTHFFSSFAFFSFFSRLR